jgi:phage shock protein C
MTDKKLYLSEENKVFGGVCGGIGEYFNKDPVVIRLIWVIVTLFTVGTGLLAYLIAWIIIPHKVKPKKSKVTKAKTKK